MTTGVEDVAVGDIVEVTLRGEVDNAGADGFTFGVNLHDFTKFPSKMSIASCNPLVKSVSRVGRRAPLVGDILSGDECQDLPVGTLVIRAREVSELVYTCSPRIKLPGYWLLTADGHPIDMPGIYNFRVLYTPEVSGA